MCYNLCVYSIIARISLSLGRIEDEVCVFSNILIFSRHKLMQCLSGRSRTFYPADIRQYNILYVLQTYLPFVKPYGFDNIIHYIMYRYYITHTYTIHVLMYITIYL